jgi:shikimate kinase
MKITKIFEKKGEDSFRDLEEKITLRILDKINYVVSLGGGGFLNEKIRKEIQEKNISIWLNWKPETLINRLRKNSRRPVILNLNDIELKKLIFNRSKIYSKSKYKINCEKMSKKEIVKKIIKVYETL